MSTGKREVRRETLEDWTYSLNSVSVLALLLGSTTDPFQMTVIRDRVLTDVTCVCVYHTREVRECVTRDWVDECRLTDSEWCLGGPPGTSRRGGRTEYGAGVLQTTTTHPEPSGLWVPGEFNHLGVGVGVVGGIRGDEVDTPRHNVCLSLCTSE